jgi:putative addiction module component (TIGR02574 family)
MAPTIHDLGIDLLSAEHRLRLIGEIWESLSIESTPIPESHRMELDRRLAAAELEPETGRPWEEVRARLRQEQ